MAEPSTATLLVTTAAGIGLSSLFPGIDGNALIGAFAGAALVAISSKNLPVMQRLAYMVISLAVGYLAAPEVINNSPLKQSGVAAFFASAGVIALTLHGIDLIKTIELPDWIRKGGRNE
ncbi:putative holin [Collimonas fungivorans]|uniref:Phage-related protein n=1 Tax=Collimonas fungivorans (strain Ter331) TaxID=1005048 RepID=G0AIP9_COLFT|nr:putative holin [Collimonas fungivorans]AEK60832.1 Phage-related protein [Collimonas fungivorans Ter331]